MAQTRLRVFEGTDGIRFVKQFTEQETQDYLANNPTTTLIR